MALHRAFFACTTFFAIFVVKFSIMNNNGLKREDFLFEICANGVESCIAAQDGGADRVELCASMPEGGTTPSCGEIRQARRLLDKTRLHVIIRPRGGDFVYSPLEAERMADDISVAREAGADGVVFGCLTPQGDVDKELCMTLLKAAEGMSVTFHRAFDCCRDPRQALEDIISLGFDRILTSGQQPSAEAGVELLRELHRQAAGRIILLAGCGVNENNITKIQQMTGIREFHFSAGEQMVSPAADSPLSESFGCRRVTTARRVKATIGRLALVAAMLFSPLAAVCAHTDSERFISDRETHERVMQAFDKKCAIVGGSYADEIALVKDEREADALRFLYAYMPLADITDYPVEFHLRNVRASFAAREQMSWGRSVPDLLFRHFVLPERINDEPLDDSRTVFFEELRPRIEGMSMKDAVLEVNHWCHEHVTYSPSDGRTLAPMACVKNALGRCGEESTFTVAALRAVGIPAREVYTPRWAHTDDNHAWVEAWADGKWYFLGACEPEPVLNLGWFNAPASRAMLMHTRAFGDYNGPEEVMLRTSCFTEINLIDNYGSSARVDFRVVDSKGRAVDDARVDFKIYNYSELCTVVSKYTDRRGRTFLTAGKGDMVVWASKDGQYGFVKCSFGRDRKVTIRIAPPAAGEVREIDIVPPAEHVLIPEVPADLVAANAVRLEYEDSLRRAYEATFYHRSEGDDARWAPYLEKSRGNHAVIRAFIEKYGCENPDRAEALLSSLSDKDLRDMPMEILEDNFTAESDQLCPRVENELIILPYKHLLQGVFDEDTKEQMRRDPSLLVKWVAENIRLNPDTRTLRIAQTPAGVWHSRITDTRSRVIFFVSLARSLGIEARRDAVTGKVQYMADGVWTDVDFGAEKQLSSPQGTLVLTYEPTRLLDDPKYYNHFTIARITSEGRTSQLNFEEGQVDMGGGTTWSSTFRDGVMLDEGLYILVSGTRLAGGSVLASTRIFEIREGQTVTLPLEFRQSDTELSVIGTFDAESRILPCEAKADGEGVEVGELPVSILSRTGRGYYVLGLVSLGQEPTDHALRDIARVKDDFNAWGRPVVLIFGSEQEARKWRSANYGTMPENLILGIDTDGSIRNSIAAQMKLQNGGRMPVFIVTDTFNRIVFCSEGYTIGLGEQMQRVIKGL